KREVFLLQITGDASGLLLKNLCIKHDKINGKLEIVSRFEYGVDRLRAGARRPLKAGRLVRLHSASSFWLRLVDLRFQGPAILPARRSAARRLRGCAKKRDRGEKNGYREHD